MNSAGPKQWGPFPIAFLVIESKHSVHVLWLCSTALPREKKTQHLAFFLRLRLQLKTMLVVQFIIVKNTVFAAVLPRSQKIIPIFDAAWDPDGHLLTSMWHFRMSVMTDSLSATSLLSQGRAGAAMCIRDFRAMKHFNLHKGSDWPVGFLFKLKNLRALDSKESVLGLRIPHLAANAPLKPTFLIRFLSEGTLD
jgi:hypothetical protein